MMNNVINNLRLYKETPNTVSGNLYLGDIYIDSIPFDQNRLVRIYLPSDYEVNLKKRYSVIYMMDGKNLFDKYTSFIKEEWEIDETIESMIKEGLDGFIIVGIDSASDGNERCMEMAPCGCNLSSIDDLPNNFDAYGDKLAEFIVNKLIPSVDKLFRTNKNYSIGGSSMGGIFSFFMGMKYPNVFKNSLCFSPAFCLYKEKIVKEELKKLKVNNNKFYFLVGDIEYENQFVSLTRYSYDYMMKIGFPANNIKYIHDLSGIHSEVFWRKYFKCALDFFVKNTKDCN